MKNRVPQSSFTEMDRDVIVKVLFPDIQVDKFEQRHSKGILVSTMYKKQIYYQYSFSNFEDIDENTISRMKKDLNRSVLNHLDGYEEPIIPDLDCKCNPKKGSKKGNCNSGSCNCG